MEMSYRTGEQGMGNTGFAGRFSQTETIFVIAFFSLFRFSTKERSAITGPACATALYFFKNQAVVIHDFSFKANTVRADFKHSYLMPEFPAGKVFWN